MVRALLNTDRRNAPSTGQCDSAEKDSDAFGAKHGHDPQNDTRDQGLYNEAAQRASPAALRRCSGLGCRARTNRRIHWVSLIFPGAVLFEIGHGETVGARQFREAGLRNDDRP